METIGKYLKKAKTWTVVLIVLQAINVVSGLYGLPKTLNPDTSMYKNMPGNMEQTMSDYFNSPMTKAYTILSLLIAIVLLVMFFLNNRKLSRQIVPTKIAYYVFIAWNVIEVIYSQLTTPKLEIEGMNFGNVVAITSLIFSLLLCLPAIMAIVNLFKAEPEDVA